MNQIVIKDLSHLRSFLSQWYKRRAFAREDANPGLRSPRRSYEEEDGNLKEAEVMLERVNLDLKSPIFIRFKTGPSNFLKFVSTSASEDHPEVLLEQHQQLRETSELGEDNRHAEDKLQENVPEEDKPEEEEERQEDKKRRQYEQEEPPEKRQRTPSTSSEGDEYQAPLSPTLKITDKTESLNRSVHKSNSMKKTQAPLPVFKIDDELEQYTTSIEISSNILKPARPASIDHPTNSAAVASTKRLWEIGEVAKSTKSVPCKDIVAGDIENIRSLWEQRESSQTDTNSKVKIPGKKYKYVAVRHGQYKRVPTEDDGVMEKAVLVPNSQVKLGIPRQHFM